jgi:hypothetical protein
MMKAVTEITTHSLLCLVVSMSQHMQPIVATEKK